MKIESSKINLKRHDANISQIFHETDQIKFWTPDLYVPFGVDERFGKYLMQLVVDKNTPQHINLKKIIEKVEKYIIKKLDVKECEFKSIFRRKMGDNDMLDSRLKQIKGRITTECEYENKRDSYLKTVYEIERDSRVKVLIEIWGYWDYRDSGIESEAETEEESEVGNEGVKRVGLILNILKVKVLDKNK